MPEELANELPQVDVKEQKEREKLQLEIDKLNNENRELTKPWWKKSQYIIALIAALSPILIGFGTLWVARDSGFLQAQAKLNEIQKLTFEQDKKKYHDSIRDLNERVLIASVKEKMLIRSIDSLKSVGLLIQQKLDSFLVDKRGVSEKIVSLIKENGRLKDELKDLNQVTLGLFDRERKYRQILDSIATSELKISIPGDNDARIYPNPIVDIATVEIKSYLLSDVTMVIVDKDGKKVFSKTFKMDTFKVVEKVDLSSLKTGVYFAFIQFANDQLFSIKITKP